MINALVVHVTATTVADDWPHTSEIARSTGGTTSTSSSDHGRGGTHPSRSYGCSPLNTRSRHRRTLITSNRLPVKTVCYTTLD